MSASLPIPSKKSAWLLAIKLIVVAFVTYYPVLYFCLEQAYQSSFSPVQLNCSDKPKDCNGARGFDLYGWVPKYVTSFSSSQADLFIKTKQDFEDFRITLKNEDFKSEHVPWIFRGGESLSENISLHYRDLPTDSLIPISFSIQPFGQKDLFDDGQRVVLSVYTKQESSQTDSRKKAVDSITFASVRIDPIAVFVMGIVKVLLLPPLSNGLLVALALAVAWSFEDTSLGVTDKTNVRQDSSSDAKKNKFWKFIKSYCGKPVCRLLMILISVLLFPCWLCLRNLRNLSDKSEWAWFCWLLFIAGAFVFVWWVGFVIRKTEQTSPLKSKISHLRARPRHQ